MDTLLINTENSYNNILYHVYSAVIKAYLLLLFFLIRGQKKSGIVMIPEAWDRII